MSYRQNKASSPLGIQLLITFLLTLLLVSNVFANRVQALAAQSRGDFKEAAKLWLQLANDGDPLAQYNLALLYQRGVGVRADENLSRYWFSMAARQGLADAYTNINAHAIKPTNAPAHVNITLGPEAWVAAQKPGYYTLQLASSTNEALIKKYYKENNLVGKAGYYRSLRSGEDWYALVYGAYPSVTAAKAAIETLPDDLKKWSPWVRNIRLIHKLMRQ